MVNNISLEAEQNIYTWRSEFMKYLNTIKIEYFSPFHLNIFSSGYLVQFTLIVVRSCRLVEIYFLNFILGKRYFIYAYFLSLRGNMDLVSFSDNNFKMLQTKVLRRTQNFKI